METGNENNTSIWRISIRGYILSEFEYYYYEISASECSQPIAKSAHGFNVFIRQYIYMPKLWNGRYR